MKGNLVIAIINLVLAVLFGVFSALDLYDADIVSGIIKAVLCIINTGSSISHYRKYRS